MSSSLEIKTLISRVSPSIRRARSRWLINSVVRRSANEERRPQVEIEYDCLQPADVAQKINTLALYTHIWPSLAVDNYMQACS